MRRNHSLLSTAFRAALFAATLFTAATASADAQMNAQCYQLAETGQVQCTGVLVGVGQGGVRVEATVPYYCAGVRDRQAPGLITGQSAPDTSGADTVAFQLMTNATNCPIGELARFGSQASMRVTVGNEVVLNRNVSVTALPQQ